MASLPFAEKGGEFAKDGVSSSAQNRGRTPAKGELPRTVVDRLKGDDVGVVDSRHSWISVCVRKGREVTVIGKGLTAGSSPPYQ
jgi:hypothetical protein